MKKIILSVIASIFFVTNAFSLDLQSMTKNIGISYNTSVYAATGTEKNNNEDASAVTTTSEYGAFTADYASIFVELGNDTVVLGIDYVPDTFDTPSNTNTQGDNGTTKTNTAQADFEDHTTVYIKANMPLGGMYMKLGYSTVDVITKESLSSGRSYGNASTDGPVFGLGYQFDNGSGVSVRAEVSGYAFDDIATNNGVAASGNRNVVEVSDMIGARGTLSLVKSF